MSKEKQIEEIAKVMCIDCAKDTSPCRIAKEGRMCESVLEQAEAVYTAGYRKQSEGEWIKHGEIGVDNAWECSACHWKTVSFTEMKHSKFCPNCGAKMKGGAE